MKQKNRQKNLYIQTKTKQAKGVWNNIQNQQIETTANIAPRHHTGRNLYNKLLLFLILQVKILNRLKLYLSYSFLYKTKEAITEIVTTI